MRHFNFIKLAIVCVIGVLAITFLIPQTSHAATLSDTFNDTNGIPLSSHTSDSGHTWAKASYWNTGELTIYNNGAGTDNIYSSTTAGSIMYLSNWTPLGTDYSVSAPLLFASDAGNNAGVMLRASSDGKYGYIVMYIRAARLFAVFKVVNGALGGIVASSYFNFVAGATPTFVAKVVGTTTPVITVTVNGSNVITYTDSTPSAQLQSAGQVGFWFSGDSAAAETTGIHISSITTTDLVEILPVSIGSPSLTSATPTTFNLSVSAANGTLPYAYQWYRSNTGGFTPGAGNIVSGATNNTLSDVPPSIGPWFYKAVVTDATNATATSTQIGLTLQAPTITNNTITDSLPASLSILAIGDSITVGGLATGADPATKMGTALSSMFGTRTATTTNQGHASATTANWLPGAGGLGYLTTAITAASSANPAATIAIITLGANDAAQSVASTTYSANLSSIASHLLSNGFSKVILNYPTYIPAGANGGATNEAATGLTNQYMAKIDLLVNGTTILAGDKTAYGFFQNNLSYLQSDQTHPTTAGALALGTMWATAAARALGVSLSATTSISGQPNIASASTTLLLANWASTGTQTITLSSDNNTDIITTSVGTSGVGTVTVTIPVGTSLFTYKINRSSAGVSNISFTNGQSWTNPSALTYDVPSPDATLSSLTISSGTLTPVFDSGTISYTDSVANNITSVTVTPTVNQANATVTVNGTTVTSGAASEAISLNVGSNTITVIVTAQDGVTTKTYTITVTRAASPAKAITAFSFNALNPVVTATIDGTAITATVPYGTNVTNLVATIITTGSSIAVGATPQVSGTTANNFTSPVTYTVTAADTTTQNYTVTVTVALPDTYTITATADSHGSISPNGATAVNNGDNQSFSITADSGYDVSDVLVDGSSVGAVSSYTFSNVVAAHTISATFALTMISGGGCSNCYVNPTIPSEGLKININGGVSTATLKSNTTSIENLQQYTNLPFTNSFTKYLQYKQTSIDIKHLQIFLNADPDTKIADSGVGSSGKETNYFGILTRKAVIKFQEKYAKDILTPHGLVKGTGYVGKTTLAKIKELMKK